MEEKSRVFQVSVLSIVLLISTVALIAVPPSASAYTWRAGVVIIGDSGFTSENGVTGGSGTPADPFIIEGWEIEGCYAGIRVENTTAHFVIRDVYVHGNGAGVLLLNVTNGTVTRAEVEFNYIGWGCYGIVVESSSMVEIVNNNVTIHDFGILITSSTLCNVSGNDVSHNNYGVYLEDVEDCSIYDNAVSESSIAAIQLDYGENVTVCETWISDQESGNGIVLQNTHGAMVAGNDLVDAGASGFMLTQVSDASLTDNTFACNWSTGFLLTEATAVTIEGNTLYGVSAGFEVASSEDVTIVDNTVSPFPDADWSVGIQLASCAAIHLENNTFSTSVGVYLLGDELRHFNTHEIPLGNTVNGSDIVYIKNQTDVLVDSLEAGQLLIANCTSVEIMSMTDSCLSTELFFVTDAVLMGNEFRSSRVMYSEDVSFLLNIISAPEYGHGISVWNSRGTQISLNLIEAGFSAVNMDGCQGIVIDSNLLTGPGNGVALYRCSDMLVISNSMLLTSMGVLVAYSMNATVEMNTVAFCAYGIGVDQSEFVAIRLNDVDQNLNGIALWDSENVEAYQNNICNNTVQAGDYYGYNNSWDAGYPNGGNYWDDYEGTDMFNGQYQNVAGPDGVGDTPYVFFGGQDTYPLMNRVGSDAIPAGDAGDDQSVWVGDEVDFDGTRSWDDGIIVNYTWTFEYDGRDVELYGPSPAFQFSIAGEYVVTLTVTDDMGSKDSDTVTITVEETVVVNEPPVADAGDDQPVEVGDTVTFDGSGSTDDVLVTNFTWNFTYDGDEVELYDEAPTFVFDIVGTYVVTLTVSDAEDETDEDTVTITVSEPAPPENVAPDADAGDDQTVDVGDTVNFDGTGSTDSDGTIVSYNWTFEYDGEDQVLTGADPTFDFDIAGTYVVTLTVTDEDGDTGTDTVTITVEEPEEEPQPVDDEKSFLESYGLPIALIVVVLVVVVLAFLLMKRKKSA